MSDIAFLVEKWKREKEARRLWRKQNPQKADPWSGSFLKPFVDFDQRVYSASHWLATGLGPILTDDCKTFIITDSWSATVAELVGFKPNSDKTRKWDKNHWKGADLVPHSQRGVKVFCIVAMQVGRNRHNRWFGLTSTALRGTLTTAVGAASLAPGISSSVASPPRLPRTPNSSFKLPSKRSWSAKSMPRT